MLVIETSLYYDARSEKRQISIIIIILTSIKFSEIEDKSKSEAKVVSARLFQVYPTEYFVTKFRTV